MEIFKNSSTVNSSERPKFELGCFLCGRTGLRDGRFCSDRCRAAFDAGFPRHDPNHARSIFAVPPANWKIVAGPSDSAIGESYGTSIVKRPRPVLKSKKVKAGPRLTNSKFVKNNEAKPNAYEDAAAIGASP